MIIKAKKGRRSLIRHNNLKGWLFCSQAVIAIAVTIVYPLIYSLVLSFTDLKLANINVHFLGFNNYKWVFSSMSGFWRAMKISALFSVVSTIVQTVLGFLVAVMLYFMHGKLQTIFKTAIYLPVVLPGAVISAMWIMMYAGDEYGVLNIILGMTNPPFQWFGNDVISFIALVITNTWRYLGITMVIYLVNICAVSRDIIESAQIDGANKFVVMMKIILPLTWSATSLNVIMSMIGGIKSFDLFYLFQTQGTLSNSMTPVSVLIYRIGLGNKDILNISLSRSVTMSIVLAAILGVASFVVNKLLGRVDKGGDV